jgi:hypothetical protein
VPPPDGDEGVTGLPEDGVPPPDPPIGAPPPEFPAFLFFFLSPGCTGTPPVTGGVTAGIVVLEFELPPPPPLDAIAITTIRKSAAPAKAASRRRRYTAGLSRIASTRPQLYTRAGDPSDGYGRISGAFSCIPAVRDSGRTSSAAGPPQRASGAVPAGESGAPGGASSGARRPRPAAARGRAGTRPLPPSCSGRRAR